MTTLLGTLEIKQKREEGDKVELYMLQSLRKWHLCKDEYYYDDLRMEEMMKELNKIKGSGKWFQQKIIKD